MSITRVAKLKQLPDVAVTLGPDVDGYSLTWNDTTKRWVLADVSGSGGGPTTASAVTYSNTDYPDLTNVKEALDSILYVAPHINSFSNTVNTVELGSTVTSITFNWSLNKTMTSLSLNEGIGSLTVTDVTNTQTGSFTSDETWTLSAGDGVNTTTATTSISFANKRYWGVSANATLTTAEIIALGSSEFASNFDKAITYDCSAGGVYPYIAYPAAFGSPSSVTVGGLAFSAFIVTAQSFTNASGHTSSYNVVRFNGVQSGAAINVVWA